MDVWYGEKMCLFKLAGQFRSFVKMSRTGFYQNAVGWLNKGRCSKKLGFSFLAAVEYYKAKYVLKVKAVYIPSSNNTSADALSRGKTPIWLEQRGAKEKLNLLELFRLLDNPKKFWCKLQNPFKVHGSSSRPSGK